jgi:hypothetical protein
MMGLINDIRKSWFNQLSNFASDNPWLSIKLFEIMNHRTFKITIAEVQELMQNSLLCPIPQGDLPYQHRFYDALLAGCIPVFLVHKTNANYTSYFYEHGIGMGKDLDSLPFPSQIPWKDIIIEMSVEVFNSQEKFNQFFLNITSDDMHNRRNKIDQIRHLLVYNWTGEIDDAFSAILNELDNINLSYDRNPAITNIYYSSLGYALRPNGTIIKLDGYKNKALYYIENGYKRLIPTWDLYITFKFDKIPITVIGLQEFDAIPEGQALAYNSTILVSKYL